MDAVIGRELDFEDLYNTPDDGNRYEILDGALVMTPSPSLVHQHAIGELYVILREAIRGLDLRVFFAPLAWRIGPGQIPEPDLVVARPDVLTKRAVEGPPLLVVEVMSPSGQRRDLVQKRLIYAEGGAAWYWVVDPAIPSLTVLRLTGDDYEETAHVEGGDAYVSDDPVKVRVVPADLIL